MVRAAASPYRAVRALLGSIGPSVDAERRTISVKGRAPLGLELVLYGADSPGVSLFDSSGERCFTLDGLERPRPRGARAAQTRRSASSTARCRATPGVEQPRGGRYAEGCAIFVGAYPAFPGGRTEIVVELWQRDVAGRR